MYWYYGFGLMMAQCAETCRRIFNFLILITNICCVIDEINVIYYRKTQQDVSYRKKIRLRHTHNGTTRIRSGTANIAELVSGPANEPQLAASLSYSNLDIFLLCKIACCFLCRQEEVKSHVREFPVMFSLYLYCSIYIFTSVQAMTV